MLSQVDEPSQRFSGVGGNVPSSLSAGQLQLCTTNWAQAARKNNPVQQLQQHTRTECVWPNVCLAPAVRAPFFSLRGRRRRCCNCCLAFAGRALSFQSFHRTFLRRLSTPTRFHPTSKNAITCFLPRSESETCMYINR